MCLAFRRRWRLFVLAAAVLVVSTGARIVCSPVDLGTLGGDESVAAAMNAAEQVVGGAETAAGQWHAFLWQDDAMADLGTLGGDNSEAHDISQGINPFVVGTSEMPDPNDPNMIVERAFLWQDGVMTDLGTLGGDSSEAWAVSDTGKVVGSAQTAEDVWHAFLWEDGGMTDLGTLGGDGSCALGINNSGQVVGWSMAPGDPNEVMDPNDPNEPNDIDPPPVRRAFVWTAVGGMVDLGTLGGRSSCAYDVAEDGYAVGWSDTAAGNPSDPNELAERHVFLWHADEGMLDMGTLGGPIAEAWGIGPAGVVGHSLDANDIHGGFCWEGSGPLQSLGQPLQGDGPVFGCDIDGLSRMVGVAQKPDGRVRGFLRR